MMHGTLNNRQWKISPNDGLKPVFFRSWEKLKMHRLRVDHRPGWEVGMIFQSVKPLNWLKLTWSLEVWNLT